MPTKHRAKLFLLAVLLSAAELSVPAAARAQDAVPTSPAAASSGVATWSVQANTPDWNQSLRVVASRQGCSSAPSDCITFVRKVAQASNVRISLAVPLDATTTADNASKYSQLSLNASFLAEVGIDDFVDQFRKLESSTSQPASVVNHLIANLKAANSALHFGATIYDDELTSPYLQDARLPATTRAQFDTIHLYIHFRQSGLTFDRSVQQAKQLFPNARIIAGAYAYDRRSYLPCSPGGQPCSTKQELDLFSQTITLQAQLLASGAIDSVEFYPGYFGREEKWDGWSNPRACAPGDLANCIANTKAMRQTALTVLGSSPPSTGSNQVISTLAGNGDTGYSGDNGVATGAQLYAPSAVAIDHVGNVYIVDSGNSVIRRVDTHSVIRTFAGNTTGDNKCGSGVPSQVVLDGPQGVAVDAAGNVYIADSLCAMVFKVDAAGKQLTPIAGSVDPHLIGDGGEATDTQLQSPSGVAVDAAGTVYIADAGSNTVRTVDQKGIIHTLAGTGAAGYAGDTASARAAQLSGPQAVAVDRAGNVYIADSGNNVIRQVDASGSIYTFAGNGSQGSTGDEGPAIAAQLFVPTGVAVDSYGGVYIADSINNVIRYVDTSRVIHTIVGTGNSGFAGDGGAAANAELAVVSGVAEIDAGPSVAGRSEYGSIELVIADTLNNRVREVSTPGVSVATH